MHPKFCNTLLFVGFWASFQPVGFSFVLTRDGNMVCDVPRGWLAYNRFSALINLREYAGKMCHFLLLAPWQLCDHGQIS